MGNETGETQTLPPFPLGHGASRLKRAKPSGPSIFELRRTPGLARPLRLRLDASGSGGSVHAHSGNHGRLRCAGRLRIVGGAGYSGTGAKLQARNVDQRRRGRVARLADNNDDVGWPKIRRLFLCSRLFAASNFIPYIGPLVSGYDTKSSAVTFTFDARDVLVNMTSTQSS